MNDLIEEKPKTEEHKSIDKISVDDIKINIDETKPVNTQAEEIVDAMAIAKAVRDENTASTLAQTKGEELKVKAKADAKKAIVDFIKVDTEKQEAERKKHETILETFGIKTHLPNWLLKIMLIPFTPLYIIISLIIGLPCGIVKVLVDNIDNILVRYEAVNEKNKPKLKVTVWILLGLSIAGAIAFLLMKFLK